LLATVNDFFAPKAHTQAIVIGREWDNLERRKEDKEKEEKS